MVWKSIIGDKVTTPYSARVQHHEGVHIPFTRRYPSRTLNSQSKLGDQPLAGRGFLTHKGLSGNGELLPLDASELCIGMAAKKYKRFLSNSIAI